MTSGREILAADFLFPNLANSLPFIFCLLKKNTASIVIEALA